MPSRFTNLAETILSFHRALEGSKTQQLSPDALTRAYEGEPDEGTMQAVIGTDETVQHRVFNYVYESYGRFPVQPIDRRVPSALALSFLETLANLHGAGGVKSSFAGFGAVPLMKIGPAFVVGHFDPSFPFSSQLPDEICIPVWLSLADYRALRDDLKSHGEITASPHVPIAKATPFPEFCRARNEDPTLADGNLRLFAEWVLTLPSIEHTEEQALRGLLGRDTPFGLDSLPVDIRLFALRTLKGQLVLKADNIELPRGLDVPLPRELSNDHQLCPLLLTDRFCFLLGDQPASPKLEDDFYNRAGLRPIVIVVPSEQFQKACAADVGNLSIENLDEFDDTEEPDFEIDVNEFASGIPSNAYQQPDVLFRFVLFSGVTKGASDGHIEYHRGNTRIRFTIDGVAADFLRPPGSTLDGLVSRIKDASKIPIDTIEGCGGRFSFAIGTRHVDVRSQLVFNHHGKPRITLRFQDKSRPFRDVASLGLTAAEIHTLSDVYRGRDGVMFVCGPTGSGKTTMIFATLSDLNQPDQIIFALEDPPELDLPGVTQIPCTADPLLERKNLPTFARALKDVLRMQPTVISVGEVRDKATAEAAVNAALTGHFVLTTMHTTDAFESVLRLTNLGMNVVDYISAVKLIVCTRLVRRACRCATLEPMTEAQQAFFLDHGIETEKHHKIPVARGCSQCRNTGYSGRMVVVEMLKITEAVKNLIYDFAHDRATMADIKLQAEKDGYRPLFHNALTKVLRGLTTLTEIDRSVSRVERESRVSAGVTQPPIEFRKAV